MSLTWSLSTTFMNLITIYGMHEPNLITIYELITIYDVHLWAFNAFAKLNNYMVRISTHLAANNGYFNGSI